MREDNRLSYGLVEDFYVLAAAYAAAVSQAQCSTDGNKLTAFQVMDLILDLNGAPMAWDTQPVGDELIELIELAQSRLDETAFADWIRGQADPGWNGKES